MRHLLTKLLSLQRLKGLDTKRNPYFAVNGIKSICKALSMSHCDIMTDLIFIPCIDTGFCVDLYYISVYNLLYMHRVSNRNM